MSARDASENGHRVEIDGRDVSCSCGWTWHGDTVWTALYEHRTGLSLSHSDIDVHFGQRPLEQQQGESHPMLTKTELIDKAAATLDMALDATDAETRDTLTRVANSYAGLCNFVTE